MDLNFSLYADDITLWTTHSSNGEIQSPLQAAANMVVAHEGAMNLTCSPHKSDFLLPSHRGAEEHISNIKTILNDTPAANVHRRRVLGLHIQSNRLNTCTLKTLHTTVDHTQRLLGRVSSKNGGLKEAELLRLVRAFVITVFWPSTTELLTSSYSPSHQEYVDTNFRGGRPFSPFWEDFSVSV
ncbi:hypothetical protein HPB50_008698 [Hyalomma asiaticum]|uniref:Uncharacterized protein n=1 Tax=Hyalomma asiaticum TaxID=266040 RepID=A0ACB7SG08_HYAAI|nr:hypothetical protein HPB50_008698 [Hyalomma asiaticum]